MGLNSYLSPMNSLVVGASGGIGLAFTQQLLSNENAVQVFATYRDSTPSIELEKLQQDYPQKLQLLRLDITEELQIEAMVKKIRQEVTKLHLVVNCVGLLHEENLQPEKNLRQIQPENLLAYFQVNSIGGILLAKHLLPLFKHSDRSILATISAKVGSIGDNQLGGWYGYRASKAALNMFLKTAAIEYKRSSPRTIIALLHPGTTDTRLSKPFQRNVPPEKLFSSDRTVRQLLAVLDKLTEADSGGFFSWDGSRLPW
ncbi:MAG: SDR family NAD(P)-dependent oxidoreductase [Snowella sp.]|nr:SDR family NAD(P)-dependent oxidoreductase [Snowella sp.]